MNGPPYNPNTPHQWKPDGGYVFLSDVSILYGTNSGHSAMPLAMGETFMSNTRVPAHTIFDKLKLITESHLNYQNTLITYSVDPGRSLLISQLLLFAPGSIYIHHSSNTPSANTTYSYQMLLQLWIHWNDHQTQVSRSKTSP